MHIDKLRISQASITNTTTIRLPFIDCCHDTLCVCIGGHVLTSVVIVYLVAPASVFLTRLVDLSRPKQNGRHFAGDIYKRIFLNENIWISIISSRQFVPNGLINNIPALFQMMAWRRPGGLVIIWNYDGLGNRRIYASIGFNELTWWLSTKESCDI